MLPVTFILFNALWIQFRFIQRCLNCMTSFFDSLLVLMILYVNAIISEMHFLNYNKLIA